MSSEDLSNVISIAAEELRAFVERIERLEEEKKEIADDIKEVYAEGKGRGYDTKVLKRIVQIRKLDPDEHEAFESLVETYMQALGMGIQERLPLGDESPRTSKPTTTVQLCDGDGKPLHEPVSIETMKAAVDIVKGTTPKRKPKPAATADADERLRNERAKGPVFA